MEFMISVLSPSTDIGGWFPQSPLNERKTRDLDRNENPILCGGPNA
jgi:hypothetical protein